LVCCIATGQISPALIHEHNRKREAAEKEVAKEKAAKERAELAEKYGGGEMKKEDVAKSMEAGLCVCLEYMTKSERRWRKGNGVILCLLVSKYV